MSKQPWYNKLAFWRGGKKGAETYIKLMLSLNVASWTSRHFHVFAMEGFRDNATVRACIKQITTAAQSCEPTPYDAKGDVIEGVIKFMELLKRPNPLQTWTEFLETAIIYRLVGGEAPIWVNGVGSQVRELWILRPDWLEISERVGGVPFKYSYTPIEKGVRMTIDAENIVMWKELNPLDPERGLSLLWSCAYAVDTLNQYAKSNKALIDNGVQPSGIVYSETYAGSANTGKPMLLEGLKWQQTAINMRDAEFINGVKLNKSEVAQVLGVPGQLIGIEGSQTFANYEQARAAMYEDTAIPLMRSLYSKLYEIAQRMGERKLAKIDVDVEAIAALEPRRVERNKFIDGAQSLSLNEKRTAMGWEEIEDDLGDMLFVDSGKIPLDMAGIMDLQMPSAEDKKPIASAKPAPNDKTPALKPGEDVQRQALNGAQMAALQQIAQAVADGQLPADTAIRLIMISIPSITEAEARDIISPADGFKPAQPPQQQQPNQPSA
jgi:HK97 family phage portal protein